MVTEQSRKDHSADIDATISSLERRARRSRIEGIVYLSLFLLIAVSVVVYFGSIAITERTININASSANIEQGIHIDQKIGWADIVGAGILRLGSVLLAVFLIQILVTFSRYRFRVSDLLYSRALALRLAGDNPDRLEIYATHLSSEGIDFGKLPKHPYSDAMSAVKALASKIPGASSK